MSRAGGAALLLVLAVAGCGGTGGATTQTTTTQAAVAPLPRSLALQLADEADAAGTALDAGDLCGAQREADALRDDTVTAINDHLVPADYQEILLGRVQEIAAAQSCPPPAEAPAPSNQERKHGKRKKHGGKND